MCVCDVHAPPQACCIKILDPQTDMRLCKILLWYDVQAKLSFLQIHINLFIHVCIHSWALISMIFFLTGDVSDVGLFSVAQNWAPMPFCNTMFSHILPFDAGFYWFGLGWMVHEITPLYTDFILCHRHIYLCLKADQSPFSVSKNHFVISIPFLSV